MKRTSAECAAARKSISKVVTHGRTAHVHHDNRSWWFAG
jgi:hypothetical protein